MDIFRAVPRDGFVEGRVFAWRESSRLPGNVPYLVDNLWEYARPPQLPSRRQAVYASPSPALALAGAASPAVPADRFIACRVVLAAPPALFQASVADARVHRDVGALQRLLNGYLQGPARTISDVNRLAPLCLPGSTREKLLQAMEKDPELAALTSHLAESVTLWQDEPDATLGEIIFTLEPGNSYRLVPV